MFNKLTKITVKSLRSLGTVSVSLIFTHRGRVGHGALTQRASSQNHPGMQSNDAQAKENNKYPL